MAHLWRGFLRGHLFWNAVDLVLVTAMTQGDNMRRNVLLTLLCICSMGQSQTLDRKMVARLKTLCTESAKQICRELGLGYDVAYFDAEKNRCYVLALNVDSVSISRKLLDISTGETLAWTLRLSAPIADSSIGYVGTTQVPWGEANDSINKWVAKWSKQQHR